MDIVSYLTINGETREIADPIARDQISDIENEISNAYNNSSQGSYNTLDERLDAIDIRISNIIGSTGEVVGSDEIIDARMEYMSSSIAPTIGDRIDNDIDALSHEIIGIHADVTADVDALRQSLLNIDATVDPDDFRLEQDPDTGLVYIVYRGERSSDGIPLAGGGGGSGGGSSSGNNAQLTVTNETGWLSHTISTGVICNVILDWSSLEDELPTGDGILTITVGNVVKSIQNVSQGILTINLGQYVTTGINKCKINIADVYGNSRTITFTINSVDLSLVTSFNTSKTFPANQEIEYTYIPKGALAKTMHFVVDGTEIGTDVITVSGRQQSYILPGMNHGAHTLLVYFTSSIDGQDVRSNELYHALTVVNSTSNTPIISSTFNQQTVKQYQMLSIPYSVYNPSSITSEVVLLANDEEVQRITVGRGQQTWNYRCSNTGALKLTIATGSISKVFNLTATESDIAVYAETENLSLYLTSYGRSNNEAIPSTWEDTDNNISCSLTGFNWSSNGWVTDDDGDTTLRINNGARVIIPYRPFASDFRSTGKTLEFEFAARDVLDYDSIPISCMNNNRGFQLTAQRATLKSEQSEISTQYKEDERIRVSIVAEKRTDSRLLLIYINGIASGVVQYPDDDDFSQQTPMQITMGADGISLDVYTVRIYDNNLTRTQVLDNWIADSRDVNEMLNRYQRNDIYDEYGTVVIEKLPSDLPYFILEAAELPQYKGDKKTISGSYIDPQNAAKSFTFEGCQINVQGTSSAPYARKNYDLQFKEGFRIRNGLQENYELASNIVPFNRFVLKADVASSEGANNVELVKLFCDIDPYKRPEEEANSKVRKGIYGFPIVVFWHNTTTGDTSFLGKYNFNLPKRAPGPYGYSGDMESWEFQNNTSNLMLFLTDYFSEAPQTDPSTGETKAAWRYDYEARFPSDEWVDYSKLQELQSFIYSTYRQAATGNTLPEPKTYRETHVEYDEVEDPQTGAISYNERLVTEDVTYTTDTAAYRLSKFKHEFEKYAEVDSFIFYYIFTELFLMVDSRAKNLFIGFSGSPTTELEYIDRKAVAEPYDMDTAIGTNNEGSLVFGYSLEDVDHINGADIFNGQNSVLWCNIRDAFSTEITTMYQRLRSNGVLSYANVEQRFEDHQDKWPEAIFNEDSWFKYIVPLIDPDPGKEPTDVYLPMMQGSKEEQRKWWLYNRFRYMDSKWNAGDALTDVIQLRGYAKSDITITPYADIYPTVKYGSYIVGSRGSHGVPVTLECPLDNVNDTEIYIYSAPQLASVGDLSGLKVGFADFSKATKLQSIKLGDNTSGYENPNLTGLSVGVNNLLSSVDVRNCINLSGTLDLSNAKNIQKVYAQNTLLTAISLPVGGILEEIYLPKTVTNLTIRNHGNIETFSIEDNDYSNITTLRIENSPTIPILDILDDISANSRIRIIGFNLTVSTITDVENFYNYLDTMRGLDESGNNVEQAVVAGTISGLGTVDGAWYASMKVRYPNIVIEYEHISSTLRYYSWDGNTLLQTEIVTDGGNGTYNGTPSRTSTAQYNYTFVGWNLDIDAITADSNAIKSVVGDRNVYAAYSRTVRTYTVRFLNEGGTVLQTVNNVPYGGNATYTGSTPVHPTAPQDNEFEGWRPQPTNIQGNTDCIAQYMDLSDPVAGIIQRTIRTAEHSTISTIRDNAFLYCYSLTTASFPNVTSIGSSAFYYCESLMTISFPSATTIGTNAFTGCSKLTTADFPSATSIGSSAFTNCYSLSTVSFPNVTSINNNAFTFCSNLVTANFPNVTRINSYTFYCCTSLTTASFSACMSIDSYAFYGCFKLTTIDFPNVSWISSGAFQSCSSLTTANFPNVSWIGNSAFQSCSNLTTADFPSATSIGSSAFTNCYSLTTINFPNVVYIGSYAFAYCRSNLTTINFPACTSVESYAFYYCSNLTTASFPNVTSIGSYAFAYCSSLMTISFPVCKIISDYAFHSCRSLTTASFSVCTFIGNYAFQNCFNLTALYLTNVSSVPILGTNAFYNTPINGYSESAGQYGSVFVPASLYNSFRTAANWENIASRIVSV